jgi:hypothetical protein
VRLVAQGFKNKEMAETILIGEQTVKNTRTTSLTNSLSRTAWNWHYTMSRTVCKAGRPYQPAADRSLAAQVCVFQIGGFGIDAP